eukprot:CAMPEP_0203824578 /NCGR_PEP_ID=MMETSP0115-20131106/52110_1 /ASSEMBLY_ACC=CAM_ASM_000227 /TAXON_ID=33651 /ORGANISM="Bicosoecid sp, Strain ms1" /LENGTH=39 /DNA_ID= /DNA_START= /DNA_END= /DNA_ORIENTATION=
MCLRAVGDLVFAVAACVGACNAVVAVAEVADGARVASAG